MNLNIKTDDFSINLSFDDSSYLNGTMVAEKIKNELLSHVENVSKYSRFDSSKDYFDSSSHSSFISAVNLAKENHINGNNGVKASFISFRKVVGNYFDKICREHGDDLFTSVDDYSHIAFGDPEGIAKAILRAIEDAKEDLSFHSIRQDEVLDSFYKHPKYNHISSDHKTFIKNLINKKITELDHSSFNEILPVIGEIPFIIIPSKIKLLDSNSHILFKGDKKAENIIPNEELIDLLRLTNITPIDFVNKLKDIRGIDLLAGNSDWNEFCRKEISSPGFNKNISSSISFDDFLSLIENNEGEFLTPCVAVNIDASNFILMAYDDVDVIISKGGLIGLHDFSKGSGSYTRIDNSVVIHSNIENFAQADGRNTFGDRQFSSSYDYELSSFDANVKLLEKENHIDLTFR